MTKLYYTNKSTGNRFQFDPNTLYVHDLYDKVLLLAQVSGGYALMDIVDSISDLLDNGIKLIQYIPLEDFTFRVGVIKEMKHSVI